MIVAIVDVLTSFIFIFTNDNRYRANYSYYHLIVASYIFFLALYNLIYSFLRSLVSAVLLVPSRRRRLLYSI
jgi:hypothetical protein